MTPEQHKGMAESSSNVKQAPLKFLVLLLIPIIVAVLWWTAKSPPPPPALAAGPTLGSTGSAPAADLPSNLGSGWRMQGKESRYNNKTLFDRINGAAPAYIRAGFVYSLGAEFTKEGQREPVIADVYDMGTHPQALGMYATERDPSYTFLEVGDGGYVASGSLNFWRGRFYVKLAGYEEGEAMDRALQELATGLSSALPVKEGGAQSLASLALLPREGRQPHSDGYSHPPLADVKGLQQVFYADYQGVGETTYRLFLVQTKSPKAAAARLDEARSYFAKDGAQIVVETEGPLRLVEVSADSITTLVCSRGAIFAGGIDLMDGGAVKAARERLIKALQPRTEESAP